MQSIKHNEWKIETLSNSYCYFLYFLLGNFNILLVNMFIKVGVLLDDVSVYKHAYDYYIKRQKTQQRGLLEISFP